MKLNRKALIDPLDSPSESLAEIHTLKITELKQERDKLKANSGKVEPNKRGQAAIPS